MSPLPRRALGVVLVLAGLAGLGFALYRRLADAGPPPAREIARQKRSVLLVTLDTTRADRLAPYGAEDVATPTLVRLAETGVTFEHAYSVAPITLVAHTSILTGLDPIEHGVRNNGLHYVSDDATTLAERLEEEGFATAAFVSAAVLDRRYNLTQGFGVYDDDFSRGRERHPRMVADRPAEATVDAASAWLDATDAGRDFFLWVHFYDPHASYSPPPPYRDEYRGRLYDGEIAYMDAELGRLLRHPRIDDETLISVIGDHGESLGEHGEQTHALLAYDSTLRVPFFLKVPGVARGTRPPVNVSQVDLVPTVLDLLGLAPPAESAGTSLVPLLEGRIRRLDRALYAETFLPYYTYGWARLRVLRQGRFKYVDSPSPELFDLDRDPHELADQSGQEPGLLHDLGRALAERLRASGDEDKEAVLALDSDALEKLRSLGYLAVGSGGASDEERGDPKELIDLHVGLERARRLMRDRLYPQAARELRRVLERDATNLAAMIDLANALAEQGQLDEAVQVLDRALSLDPDYSRLHLQMARLEGRRDRHEQALALIEVALELDPRSLEAKIQKASQLHLLKRRAEAVTVLAETLAANPDVPRLDAVYAQLVEIPGGALPAAEERLRRALARDPFLVSAWRLLGEVLERVGRGEEALTAYREGLKRQPDDVELHARIGLLLARRHAGAETRVHLLEALRLSREPRPELRVALGGWLAERGLFGEAQAEYAKVLAVEPGHPGARNNRAIAYYRTGRPEEAERELLELVAEYPGHADAHNNLAVLALEAGRSADAVRHARRALAVSPRMAEGWNNLGLALTREHETAAARRAYERALRVDPGYWQAHLNLGVLLRENGEPLEAVRILEGLIERMPELSDAHLELGHLFSGPLVDAERARLHYNAFLRQTPQHPLAETVRRRLAELGL